MRYYLALMLFSFGCALSHEPAVPCALVLTHPRVANGWVRGDASAAEGEWEAEGFIATLDRVSCAQREQERVFRMSGFPENEPFNIYIEVYDRDPRASRWDQYRLETYDLDTGERIYARVWNLPSDAAEGIIAP